MLGVIPLPYKILGAALLVAAIYLGGYMKGRSVIQDKWDMAVAQAQVAEAKRQAAQSEATVRVVTKYVDRVKVVKERSDEVIREVPVYIPSDATCPAGIRVLHDAAARQLPVPDGPGGADEAPVPARDLASTVAKNYGTCHETAEQLKALQDWVREQQRVK